VIPPFFVCRGGLDGLGYLGDLDWQSRITIIVTGIIIVNVIISRIPAQILVDILAFVALVIRIVISIFSLLPLCLL
jgi:hypothetical protein